MKRGVSFLLSLIMMLGLAVPAWAETPPGADMEQNLSAITLLVKEALAVDDGYTDFYGDYYDGLTPSWSLTWSDETRQLSVEASPAGKVLNVYRWINSDSTDRF